MQKCLTTLFTVTAAAAVLTALPSCEQRREEDNSALLGDQGEPEYVVAVVLDVSGSYVERINGPKPLAYSFFQKLTTRYAKDRGDSGDRILIAQISQKEPAVIWEGRPNRLRADFTAGASAFRDFVLARSDPNGSRVYAAIATVVERVLRYPGVQAGRTRSAIYVLSDMEDNDPQGPAQKQRLLDALQRYGKVRHACMGLYWVRDGQLADEWTRNLAAAGVRHLVVDDDNNDPPIPTFD